jgi:hypothetical protein
MVDPKIMHALIWRQSGGEPWSFTVPGERRPEVYGTAGDAIGAAHATYPDDVSIRVGLTGPAGYLSIRDRGDVRTVSEHRPCGTSDTQLAERCTASPRLKGDAIDCAIAVYCGSWERPDNAFADAVRISVANTDAPDFEMPANTEFGLADSAAALQSHDIAVAPAAAPDDRERAWSSALFAAESQPFDRSSTGGSASERTAAGAQKSDVSGAGPISTSPRPDSLFVPRSAQRNSP